MPNDAYIGEHSENNITEVLTDYSCYLSYRCSTETWDPSCLVFKMTMRHTHREKYNRQMADCSTLVFVGKTFMKAHMNTE